MIDLGAWNFFLCIFTAQQRKNRSRCIAVLISAAIATIAACVFVLGTYVQVLTTDKGTETLHGIKGLKICTQYAHEHACVLNAETLNAYLDLYHKTEEISGSRAAIDACETEYPGVGVLMSKLYRGNLLNSAEEVDAWDFGTISSADDIGKRVKEYIMSYFYGAQFLYSSNEEAFAQRRAVEIGKDWQKGIVNDAADHWELYLEARQIMMIFLAVLGIFLAGSFFTQDKFNGMDQILSTAATENLHMVSRGYLWSGMAVLAGAWAIVNIMLSVAFLVPFSYCDGNVPLQITAADLLQSPYQWTMWQYYGITLIGSLVMLLSIYIICSVIASVGRDLFPALSFGFMAEILPTAILVFTQLQENKAFFHTVILMPLSNLVDMLYLFSYCSYGFAGYRMDSFRVSMLLSCFVIAAGCCFVPRLYVRLLRVL